MINKRIIAKAVGGLLALESALMMVCFAVSLYFGEPAWRIWTAPIVSALAVGAGLWFYGRQAQHQVGRRDGYFIVGSTWIIFSVFGMLPFLLSHSTDRLSIAFFETVSGFTTTGATGFSKVEILPNSLLFWRSLTHWIGGMGIIFFTVAVLPTLGIGEQKVFAAEATGVKIGKLHPRISTTAHWLWSLYFLLTASCTVAYFLCGMSLWDAVNHALATLATGGFSTHTESIGWFNSPAIEYVAILFMWTASVNFSLTYLLLVKRRVRQVFRDTELRAYITVCLMATVLLAISYALANVDFSQFSLTREGLLRFLSNAEESVRSGLFQAVSLQTTTGFTKHDIMAWPSFCWMVVILICFCGGCSGSTSGGVKVVRLVFVAKIVHNEFLRILHPRAVLPIRLGEETVEHAVVRSAVAYLFLYVVLLFFGATCMLLMDFSVLDAFGLTLSSLSNIGPALGYAVGPLGAWDVLPDTAIWLQSFLMLAGRLEIFSLILPFIPSFWRNR